MKAIILAGGFGSRLSEMTGEIPKPMVEIGGRPILWHIMKGLAHFGITEFVIALGYKADVIQDYFRYPENVKGWSVDLVATGTYSPTGERLRRILTRIKDETVLMTYGDGVSDIDINLLLNFHKGHAGLATVTAVRPPARFGVLHFKDLRVDRFNEKPREGWINGGFFVLEREVLSYLKQDCILEHEPLQTLAKDGHLFGYQHDGFWQCMDTLRDVRLLEGLWHNGTAPWKVW